MTTTNRVEVTVDQQACEGTAFCVRTLPAVFSLNGDGVAEVDQTGVARADLDELHDVENMCPTLAIVVDEP